MPWWTSTYYTAKHENPTKAIKDILQQIIDITPKPIKTPNFPDLKEEKRNKNRNIKETYLLASSWRAHNFSSSSSSSSSSSTVLTKRRGNKTKYGLANVEERKKGEVVGEEAPQKQGQLGVSLCIISINYI